MHPETAPSLPEVIDAVRAYCEKHHPDDVVVSLRLAFLSGCKLLSPIPPGRTEARRSCERRHSEDYRSIVWDGETFTITPSQAAVVRALWSAMDDGTHELAQAYLLEAADSQADRLRDLFRDSPLWGRVVVPGAGKGTFRLAE